MQTPINMQIAYDILKPLMNKRFANHTVVSKEFTSFESLQNYIKGKDIGCYAPTCDQTTTPYTIVVLFTIPKEVQDDIFTQ